MVVRMEHANMHVRYFDDAVRFITAAFPHFRVRSEAIREGGQRWMHIGDDDTYIALNETHCSRSDFVPYSGKPGINHLGYEVSEVDALRQRLLEQGFEESTYPNKHPFRKRVYFLDREGNDWEFVEYGSTKQSERNDYSLPD